ncbi:alkaline phosphatase [Pelagibius litoralis]|uniref:Alkaline phosphatase n=1 Tax=Pelagibius litoralis TaxID=374515 RepID=A0A967EUW8_9PROT|nr:alkaline phosphatase D family protein [Pelagibius litoralis]NIA67821.1 alkaline phosphatase [Pelagibius litoralis]
MPLPRPSRSPALYSRRKVLRGGAAGAGLVGAGLLGFPAIAQSNRPVFTHGVQSGDVTTNSGMIWARADRPSRLLVEVATSDSFGSAQRLRGPATIAANDFAAKMDLTDLPAGQDIFYRLQWQDLADVNLLSEPTVGRFRTGPGDKRDITFVWTGDTCGQGWGINLDWGGMRCYETMRGNRPDFFIHSGDTIYADGPIQAEQTQPDGSIWKNVVTEEKSKVAETLAEFRGNYKYNLMDENVKRFNAEVPMLAQWDDHEVVNNWYPGEMLISDDRYKVKSASLLASRANKAFLEYMPIRQHASDRERIYRKIAYGPMLDIFFLDLRSYRGPNSANDQATASRDTDFLGPQQLRWLKQEMLASKATWKVIASDMPLGLIVYDNWRDKSTFENGANGNGPVLGREHDIADLLRFIKHNDIKQTVFFTADVHYTAAHYYDPSKAQFRDFNPFWEFVSGPVHAGSFGPGEMDNTFGPQVMYSKDPGGEPNLPPSSELQFFGHVKIDGETEAMTVTLKDLNDKALYTVTLEAAGA